jgi:hypothetical protein
MMLDGGISMTTESPHHKSRIDDALLAELMAYLPKVMRKFYVLSFVAVFASIISYMVLAVHYTKEVPPQWLLPFIRTPIPWMMGYEALVVIIMCLGRNFRKYSKYKSVHVPVQHFVQAMDLVASCDKKPSRRKIKKALQLMEGAEPSLGHLEAFKRAHENMKACLAKMM